MEKYGLGQTHDFVEREIAKPQLQKLLGANILFKEVRTRSPSPPAVTATGDAFGRQHIAPPAATGADRFRGA